MSDVTRILQSIDSGESRDGGAADELLPLVYEELRRLAASKMAKEIPGQTLQPTALVHEAWIRLAGNQSQQWENRGHFFGAAAEAMRRILVEKARYKNRQRHGSGHQPISLDDHHVPADMNDEQLLAVHDSLDELEEINPLAAKIVKLRYFVGLTMEESATALEMPRRSAERLWSYAKAWLHRKMRHSQD